MPCHLLWVICEYKRGKVLRTGESNEGRLYIVLGEIMRCTEHSGGNEPKMTYGIDAAIENIT